MSVNIYDKNTGELTKVAGNSKDPNIEFPTTPAGKFLKDDNTWDNVPNPSVVTGATATTDGESGLVPQPLAGDQDKFLKGDGSFGNIPKANNDITNLAPAYDATLTYDVGDLVTYIDSQGSGKLYKCIVAITTPEAFNINKWDDVTTSEVYGRKSTIISTVTSDGTKRRDELLFSLIDGVTIDPESEYLLTQTENSTATVSLYHERLASSTQIQLAEPFIGIALPTSCRNITLDVTGSSSCKAGSIEFTTNGTNASDTSNIISGAGEYTFTLYKLATK